MSTKASLRGFITIGLLPALLIFIAFVIVPIFWSAYYGFFEWTGMGAAKYIGFSNYVEVVQDPIFWRAFKNNLIIVAASVFGQVPISLVLALLLLKNTLFGRFVRSSVFMPVVLSSVVIGLIWGYIYSPQIGVINYTLDHIGLSSWKRDWLSDPRINMYSLSVPVIWAYLGPYLIMFIAAMHNIPSEVIDAASIDGAISFRKLYYVTIPMIWNTIKVTIVIVIAGSLKSFDLIFVMTQGGPAQSTELLATFMYNNTFNIYRYGYGSAISTMIVILSLILIVGSQILMKRDSR
jgi:raffinose/stachyose/melibiose transport system permease protein